MAGRIGSNPNAKHPYPVQTLRSAHSMVGLDRPESTRICVCLLLKSNIFIYEMSVWSSGMILASGARGRESILTRGRNYFLFFICMCRNVDTRNGIEKIEVRHMRWHVND